MKTPTASSSAEPLGPALFFDQQHAIEDKRQAKKQESKR
jgi:hypothetical protein